MALCLAEFFLHRKSPAASVDTALLIIDPIHQIADRFGNFFEGKHIFFQLRIHAKRNF